jgi:CheY-like chemotaxis protein
MDLNMPVMGGMESAFKIKKHYKEINLISVENSQLPYMVALSASDLDRKLIE